MSELALARIRENKETKSPRLNLARCGLTTLPEELFDCVWLEELIVSNRIYNRETDEWEMMAESGPFNVLREIPEGIRRLKRLVVVYFGGSGLIIDELYSYIFQDDWEISDISVLQHFGKLKTLGLGYCERITDFSVLRHLSKLKSLSLNRSTIRDISVLQGLQKLQTLSLYEAKISDISVLKYLTQLQELDVFDIQASDISVLEYQGQLQSLKLRYCEWITDFTVFQNLVDLQVLDLRGTKIRDISVFRHMKQLKSLKLADCEGITDFSVLQDLTDLNTLDLSVTKISDLSMLRHVGQLKSLKLADCEGITDFSVLQDLTDLNTLDLSVTKISDLSMLRHVGQLKSLKLAHCEWITDFSILQDLPNLEELDLSGTNISDISLLRSLRHLKKLDLGFNKRITDFSIIQDLKCLNTLILRNTNIVNISAFQNLTQLQTLDLNGTKVRDISVFQHFLHLQILNLNGTEICDISVFRHLSQLQTLELNETNISDFSFLQHLKRLNTLNLRNTNIIDISALHELDQLHSLSLNGTKIRDITALQHLEHLKTLDLNRTKINDLSVFQHLGHLKSLSLKGTRIKDITVLEHLGQLLSLNLRNTKISDITALQYLKHLKLLDLRKTKISDISPIFHLIRNKNSVLWDESGGGRGIFFFDNPLTHPPIEIVKEGNEAILNYFRELEEGEETVYEAKLLIIGEAGTGKTTFSRKIRDSHAEMPIEVEDTTRGIDIIPFILKGENEPNFLMNIWDFGGQDVYHGIHQLFLTKRSLYVLLLDGRIEENPHYWLQTQELLGGDSPVMIILNQKGTIRQNAAFNEWKGDYNNLKSYDEINLQNDLLRIQVLTQAVESNIRTLPHFEKGEKLPKKWVAIRNRLKQEKRNYIGLERYQEICSEEGIDEWDRQDYLSDYLHDLGTVLHFSNQPQLKKILFLNPQWATDAIYRVLDHTKEQEKSGYFKREDLNALWHEASYRNVFEELLALMEQFELCFPVAGKDSFIVPQLLPADKPEGYRWQEDSGELALRYQYDFLPKGIVPRVVVRLHTLLASNEIFWKRGALFEREGAIAEVVEHFRDKYIHVRVKGRNRRRLLTIIAHQIDEINRTFHFSERMNVHQLIPCNCRECRGKKPSYFRMSHIQHAINRKKKEIECPQSFDNVIVASLLEETFWQDGTYKSYDVLQPLIKRVDYVRQLLADGQIKAALQELGDGMKSGDHAHEVLAHLSSYESIQNGIRAGTISQEQQRLEINRLIQAASELSYRLAEEYPEKAQVYIKISPPLPDPVTTKGNAGFSAEGGHTINIYGNVGTLIPDNQAPITQSIDQRDQSIHVKIVNDLPQIRQLIAEIFAHDSDLLDENDVEDIEEVLTEISADPKPQSEKQQKKWKRWLGKASKTGKKFVGGRMEKTGDSIISEGVKDWVEGGGLDTVAEFVTQL